jgi:hypothetical protein
MRGEPSVVDASTIRATTGTTVQAAEAQAQLRSIARFRGSFCPPRSIRAAINAKIGKKSVTRTAAATTLEGYPSSAGAVPASI